MRSNVSDTQGTHTHTQVQTKATDNISAALSLDEPSGKKTRHPDSEREGKEIGSVMQFHGKKKTGRKDAFEKNGAGVEKPLR